MHSSLACLVVGGMVRARVVLPFLSAAVSPPWLVVSVCIRWIFDERSCRRLNMAIHYHVLMGCHI